MIVFRLGKAMHSRDLSGRGAELVGGRWNSRRRAALYTCSSGALCVTEVAVHIPMGIIPLDYNLTKLEIPDGISIFELPKDKYPNDWNTFPYPFSTQSFGDSFLKDGKFLVMKVSSSVVEGDFNYLVNPQHPDTSKIRILNVNPFKFDKRLFRM